MDWWLKTKRAAAAFWIIWRPVRTELQISDYTSVCLAVEGADVTTANPGYPSWSQNSHFLFILLIILFSVYVSSHFSLLRTKKFGAKMKREKILRKLVDLRHMP